MIKYGSLKDFEILKYKLAQMYTFFQENADEATANKSLELLKKVDKNDLTIAFCGHFSAGKSSLINELIGEKLLPSSPIPTSANNVSIKTGEDYAKIHYRDGSAKLFLSPYEYEMVRDYCKDGENVSSIEISYNSDTLPERVCIVDTPGIDSTDDAHRLSTLSTLHLADIVFYVMDYNHVQAQLNFTFTSELANNGRDIYLIINQIDKYNENELSFRSFQDSVLKAFQAWGVQPKRIFYTSLKEREHPYNEFHELQEYIKKIISEKDDFLPTSYAARMRHLIEEHMDAIREADAIEIEQYDRILSTYPSEYEGLSDKLQNSQKKLDELHLSIDTKKEEMDSRLENIIKNAYLMPYETRELAENYLESTQSNFKRGLFFSRNKTEMEKTIRRSAFFKNFEEKVTEQLVWHLKEELKGMMEEEHLDDAELHSLAQHYTIPLSIDTLQKATKPGAVLSGEYVLNYTSDLENIVKKMARAELQSWKEKYMSILGNNIRSEIHRLHEEIDEYNELYITWIKRSELKKTHEKVNKDLDNIIQSSHIKKEIDMRELLKDDEKIEIIQTNGESSKQVEEKKGDAFFQINKAPRTNVDEKDEIVQKKKTCKKLMHSANTLSRVPGFKKISEGLKIKAQSIEEQQFTVALFGAFSAGKSSFANSLIGEKLLPVSPNPTTATINKIKPVDAEHHHGLVHITLKSDQNLLNEINRSLSHFEQHAATLDVAASMISNSTFQCIEDRTQDRMHLSFLHAFSNGYDQFKDELGKILISNCDKFQEYVANEEKSCLVEAVEIYYECELTKKGITLVDTPGADSIHARHTNVAFEYMKDSDAILYITYYNHAFAKSDREFLIQLGRVKDSFILDKMFFIVNAVDLANTEEEKNEVLSYVHGELTAYGIRNPALFPVSSLMALNEKKQNMTETDSGIQTFENAFYHFISHELASITVKTGMAEWERALHQLQTYIDNAKEGNAKKAEKRDQYKKQQIDNIETLKNISLDLYENQLQQEIEELTFYIKQRVFFRYSHFFKESFNPSTLRDDGRNLKKMLRLALDEFLEDFGYEITQELRATTIRVEAHLKKLMADVFQMLEKKIKKLNHELTLSQNTIEEFESLTFNSPFNNDHVQSLQKVLTLFKNPKAFFEKNEKQMMSDALLEQIKPICKIHIDEETRRLQSYYNEEFNRQVQQLADQIMMDTNEYYEGIFTLLDENYSVEMLEQIYEELKNE